MATIQNDFDDDSVIPLHNKNANPERRQSRYIDINHIHNHKDYFDIQELAEESDSGSVSESS